MIRRLLWGLGGAVAVFCCTAAIGLLYLRWFDPGVTSVQLQRRIEALVQGAPSEQRYEFIPLARIAEPLQHAVVAAEDSRFFTHRGIDWTELEHIAVEPRGQRRRGGSTITQQLVKNLFLTTHRSALRKAIEIPLALLAELILSKPRILELYLNVVEWGPGVFGAEAAAHYHYGVPASALNRDQAARLAACLPAPRRRRPQRMNAYSSAILRRMRRMAW